jgi:hypothetical protein
MNEKNNEVQPIHAVIDKDDLTDVWKQLYLSDMRITMNKAIPIYGL